MFPPGCTGNWMRAGEAFRLRMDPQASPSFEGRTGSRRAGGSRSNRGYAYQSLGPREGDAVVGGRYLATASADFIHWLNPQWGAAVFYDMGDASDSARVHSSCSYGRNAWGSLPSCPRAASTAVCTMPSTTAVNSEPTNGAAESEIARLVTHGANLETSAQKLVALANERDGSDNISVQLIRVRGVERVGMYRGRPYKLR